MSIPIPEFPCPYCGGINVSTSNFGGDKPIPENDDVGVCDACFNVYRFVASPFGLSARRLRVDEWYVLEDGRVIGARADLMAAARRTDVTDD